MAEIASGFSLPQDNDESDRLIAIISAESLAAVVHQSGSVVAVMIAVDAIIGHNTNDRLTSLSIVPMPDSETTEMGKQHLGERDRVVPRKRRVLSCPTGIVDVPRKYSLVDGKGIVGKTTGNQKRLTGPLD